MAVSYDKIQRAIILRANQLQADNASTLATNYANTTIGDTQMGDRAIEFPALAINDAILDAETKIIHAIGANVHSPYRNHFAGVTGNMTNGATIPNVDSFSVPKVGYITDVRDAATSQKLTAVPFQVVQGYNNLKTNIVKVNPYYYYTDNVRIWHTVTNAIADVVVWSRDTELALMVATPTRGNCTFPDALVEIIIIGSLSYIFRGDFNNQQAQAYRNYFEQAVQQLATGSMELTITRTAVE